MAQLNDAHIRKEQVFAKFQDFNIPSLMLKLGHDQTDGASLNWNKILPLLVKWKN